MMHAGICSATPAAIAHERGVGGNFFGLPFMKNSIEGAALDISWVAGLLGHIRAEAGLGMTSHDLQGGTTVHLDNDHEWTLSAFGTYEIHQKKRDTEIRV